MSAAAPLYSHLRTLVRGITKKNFRPTFAEISQVIYAAQLSARAARDERSQRKLRCGARRARRSHFPAIPTPPAPPPQLVALYGQDTHAFVLSCLISEIDFKESKPAPQSKLKLVVLLKYLLATLALRPSFATTLCRALRDANSGGSKRRGGAGFRVTVDSMDAFCSRLGLSACQAVVIALGLTQSDEPAVQAEGAVLLRRKLPLLGDRASGDAAVDDEISSWAGGVGAGLSEGILPPSTIHQLVFVLLTRPEFASPACAAEEREACLGVLRNHAGLDPAIVLAEVRPDPSCAKLALPSPELLLRPLAPSVGLDDAARLEEGNAQHAALFAMLRERQTRAATPGSGFDSDGAIAAAVTHGIPIEMLVMEMGYAATSSAAALRDVLAVGGYGAPSSSGGARQLEPSDVARLIVMMANSLEGNASALSPQLYNAFVLAETGASAAASGAADTDSWRLDSLLAVLVEDAPSLEWQSVVRALDYPGFECKDARALDFMMKAYARGSGSREPPFGALLAPWRNERGQLALLKWAIIAPPAVLSFATSPHRIVPPNELLAKPYGTDNRAWCSLDLIAALLRLTAGPTLGGVKRLFDYPLRQCPELLAAALLFMTPGWHGFGTEMLTKQLLPTFVRGASGKHTQILSLLWHDALKFDLNAAGSGLAAPLLDATTRPGTGQEMVVHAIVAYFNAAGFACVPRLLELASHLTGLTAILLAHPHHGLAFAFSVAKANALLSAEERASDGGAVAAAEAAAAAAAGAQEQQRSGRSGRRGGKKAQSAARARAAAASAAESSFPRSFPSDALDGAGQVRRSAVLSSLRHVLLLIPPYSFPCAHMFLPSILFSRPLSAALRLREVAAREARARRGALLLGARSARRGVRRLRRDRAPLR